MIVLDACVLIAAIDATDAHHAAARNIVTCAEDLAVSVLSLAEGLVRPVQTELAAAMLAHLRTLDIEVLPLPASAALPLAELRARTGLRMPDVVVLWLAQSRQARVATFDRTLAAEAQARGLEVVGV